MGSVISETECPQCGYQYAVSDYYYKSAEEYVFCKRCGYSYKCEIVNRPKGEYPDDWVPEYKEIEDVGAGSYEIMGKEGVGQVGTFSKNDNIEKLKKEAKQMIKDDKGEKIKSFLIHFKKGEKFFTQDMITDKIEPFKSEYECLEKEK